VNQEQRERLSGVRQAADRAAMLTRQLLAFSRRQVPQTRIVDLNHVVEDLLGMLQRLIKENVDLTFRPADGRLTIETRNLRVEGRRGRQADKVPAGDYALILVRDTGHGMDREVQARVFEPFFTTKKMGEGTGLGLSMAYGIVKQSNGHIRLESQAGVGSTFKIYLPRVDAAEVAAAAPVSPSPLPRGSETILLAEDESGLRELIGTYLGGLGYRVLTAPNGVAGIGRAFAPGDDSPAAQRFCHAQDGGARAGGRAAENGAAT
jgi:signal transduction histidine kinase